MQAILTAQAGALGLALAEAGNARVVRQLEPGVALCTDAKRPKNPIFLRHICPAAVEVPLDGTAADIEALRAALPPLLDVLKAGQGTFSVQTRIMEGYQPAYKRFDVNTPLAADIQAAGLALDVKNPVQVLSVSLAEGTGWLGVSTAAENISGWAGGARRYKVEPGQISRAEFKLLEALETFGIAVQDGGYALDLGAAPGGWTRVLRRRGLYVTAVDPAALDPRVAADKRVTHYRATAQAYFRRPPQQVDLMVNDMKMDSAQSAGLMVEGAGCLKADGVALLTLKLPEDETQWMPRIDQAFGILAGVYDVAGIRQLFHNRNEVTVYMTKKNG